MTEIIKRCSWCEVDPLYIKYHDNEWGNPIYDDQQLFAQLMLEGAQAGLSWITILKKRANYYNAFDNFDANKIIQYDAEKVESLMQNKGIVRNRLKINSVITNSKAFLKIQQAEGFSNYLWNFVNHKPVINQPKSLKDLPTKTALSELISSDLKKKGFKFVGPTIIYAFIQAVGMVNDHFVDCNFK